MVPKKFIEKAKKFAYEQTEKFGAPTLFYIELSNEKGQWLAEQLDADKDIVLLGTLLMDCMIGMAIKEGRIGEHVTMSEEKTKGILSEFTELDEKVKENIIHCVRQHHGGEEFFSLEAEICCNADCYRFVSVKGVIGGINSWPDADLEDMVNFYLKKADEKWNVLTLDICKKELEPQYKSIKTLLESYREWGKVDVRYSN